MIRSFELEPVQTLIDMIPCTSCETYFEALPGDTLCHVCSHSEEVKQMMRPYQRAAMETLNSDDISYDHTGELLDILI